MRTTFVIHALGNGGAERVMSTMANYWADHGWSVTILTFDDTPPFYDLRPRVAVRSLGIAGQSLRLLERVVHNLRRIVVLRRAIQQTRPQVVISFMDQVNVLTILAVSALRVPVIVAEHMDPERTALGPAWRLLRRLLYPRATRVVVLSRTAFDYFSESIQRRAWIIPNPVTVPNTLVETVAPDARQATFTLIAVGRLNPEKGYELLLRAFVKPADRHPSWSLDVWGEGPLRAELEALRDDLGLRGRVHFRGRTKDPFTKLLRADLFVLSSRTEAFPMALCEAMACGLPVVSFDCPSGPREIIRDGIDGVLVPAEDVSALAEALDRLMADPSERNRVAKHAPDVLDRFGLVKVMTMWETMIDEARAARPGAVAGSLPPMRHE